MIEKAVKDAKNLAASLVLSFQVKALYNERELEELLEAIDGRGAFCRHMGDGRHKLRIPTDIPWVPFYYTIRDCNSVTLTDVVTVHGKQAALLMPGV